MLIQKLGMVLGSVAGLAPAGRTGKSLAGKAEAHLPVCPPHRSLVEFCASGMVQQTAPDAELPCSGVSVSPPGPRALG